MKKEKMKSIFTYHSRAAVSALIMVFLALPVLAQEKDTSQEGEKKLCASVIAQVQEPGAPALWSVGQSKEEPALYRLFMVQDREGTSSDCQRWKLVILALDNATGIGKWKEKTLGELALSRTVFCGGPIPCLAYYPGGFAVLEADSAAPCLLYAAHLDARAGFMLWTEYPYLVLTCVPSETRKEIARELEFRALHLRNVGPMSVVWARARDKDKWLAMSASGHLLELSTVDVEPRKPVSGADSMNASGRIRLVGGIEGIANLEPLPFEGPGESLRGKVLQSRCLGAGEIAECSFPVLCTGPQFDRGQKELMIFQVTVSADNEVASKLVETAKLAQTTSVPIVLVGQTPSRMELQWCCVQQSGTERQLLIGRYTPEKSVEWEALPFLQEGDIIGGYVDAKTGPHIFVLNKTDNRADILLVWWQKEGE